MEYKSAEKNTDMGDKQVNSGKERKQVKWH